MSANEPTILVQLVPADKLPAGVQPGPPGLHWTEIQCRPMESPLLVMGGRTDQIAAQLTPEGFRALARLAVQHIEAGHTILSACGCTERWWMRYGPAYALAPGADGEVGIAPANMATN